jgi:hypothetical protein
MLEFADEGREIGSRLGLCGGAGIESEDFAHACAAGRSPQPSKMGKICQKKSAGLGGKAGREER